MSVIQIFDTYCTVIVLLQFKFIFRGNWYPIFHLRMNANLCSNITWNVLLNQPIWIGSKQKHKRITCKKTFWTSLDETDLKNMFSCLEQMWFFLNADKSMPALKVLPEKVAQYLNLKKQRINHFLQV